MKTFLIRACVFGIAASGVLAAVMVVRTAALRPMAVATSAADPLPLDAEGAIERLAGALQIRTVAADAEVADWALFQDELERSFPLTHATLVRESVRDGALLFTWPGSDPALDPILLAAHMDVPPVPASDLEAWTHPPFGGVVTDGSVWGAGVRGPKAALVATLEAVEALLESDFVPERTVLLAFTHDGTTAEADGAAAMAELLRTRGIQPAWALGDGVGLVTGGVPGVRGAVGVVGVTETGLVRLRIGGDGGDGGGASAEASDPSVPDGVVDRLRTAPFAPAVRAPTRTFLHTLGPHMDPGTRMLVANLWLLQGPVARAMSGSPFMDRMLRSTVDVADGGEVLVRVAPWDAPEGVVARIRDHLGASPEVLDVRGTPIPPSGTSSWESDGFEALRTAAHRSFAELLVVAPTVLPRTTEMRHYEGLARDVYRFLPFRMDVSSSGGDEMDERIPVGAYLDAVRFYAELIRLGAGAG